MKTQTITFLSILVAGVFAGVGLATAGERADICHLKGNGQFVQIQVSVNALDAHYAKGALDPFILFEDADGDGYGNAASFIQTCDASMAGYVTNDSDPDDNNAALWSEYQQYQDATVEDEGEWEDEEGAEGEGY